MKKLILVIFTILFFVGCNHNSDQVVGFNATLNYLNNSESRAIANDYPQIEAIELWVVEEGGLKPIMNPSNVSLKTAPTLSLSTVELSALESLELVLDSGKLYNFWLRISTVSERDFVGNSEVYITLNTTTVKIDLFETDSSKLNLTAEEWEEYISTNF